MARKPLTDEQKAAKLAEETAKNATKRTYIKKPDVMETTTPQTTTPVENTATNNSVTETTQTVTPAPVTNTPASTTPAPEVKTEATKGPVIKNNEYKPFSGTVVKRDYSTVKIDSTLLDKEIPEVGGMGSSGTGTGAIPQPNAHELLNKPIDPNPAVTPDANNNPVANATGFNNLSPAEQDEAAEQAVEVALGIYDKMHLAGRTLCKVSDRRLRKMEFNNEINLDIVIAPASEESPELTLRGFVQQINNDIDTEIVVKPAFVEKVKPPMIRLAKKYGIGLSDAYYLMYAFGEDIAVKGAVMYGLRSTVNDMLGAYGKQYKELVAAHEKQQNEIREAQAREASLRAELEDKNRELASKKITPVAETTIPTE